MNLYSIIHGSRRPWAKFLLVIKLTFILLFASLMAMSEPIYSQSMKLNLSTENSSLLDIFRQIEDQSEFHFSLTQDEVKSIEHLSIEMNNVSISDILDHVLKKTGLGYKIIDRNVLIKKKGNGEQRIDITQKETKVTGKVTDKKGEPIPGVSVVVKGTTTGVITDTNGNYAFADIAENSVLQFSFVGMSPQEIAISGKKSVDVVLEEENIRLQEVVAVGYGIQKKVNLTGAVSSIDFNNETIKSRSLTNLSSALAGMTSGASIIQSNGQPSGGEATIRIRGTGSLNVSQNPLVIIDGQVGDMSNVHPNDVDNISVLKDAASSAIYGSRASNGVILITTKTGGNTNNKVTFKYDGYLGQGDATKTHDVVSNTADHMELINLLDKNSGVTPTFSQEEINEWREKSKTDPIGYPNTRWWDALSQRQIVQNHNLSASGGNERIKFYSSINLYDNGGFVPNSGYKRTTFRNNMTYKVNNWLSLGNNLSVLDGKGDPGGLIGDYWLTAGSPGIVPKHPDGRYGGSQVIKMAYVAENPLASTETATGETNTRNVTEKLFAILSPLKGLKITGSYFIEREDYDNWSSSNPVDLWNFQNETIAADRTTGKILSVSQGYQKYERQIYDLFADYDKSLGNHDLHFLAGYNQEYYKSSSFSGSKQDLLSVDIPVLNAASQNPAVSGTTADNALQSYFGRFNYSYKNKYLLESNLRYDGSSKFAPKKRWGLFPSFAIGWRISEENFWSKENQVFNDLKIRASWGKLGNSGIGDYEWQNFYKPAKYSFNGAPVNTINYSSLASEGITWETTNVLNIGADFRIVNKINGSFNYYDKYTDGILVREPIPYVNGGIEAPRVNSAEVRNSGFEAELQYNTKIGNLDVSVGAMASYNKNVIEKYKGSYYEPHGIGVWTEGKPVGIYWIREVDYIVREQSTVDELIADGWSFKPSTPGVGDFMYKNNNSDKVVDDNDRILKGNPIPLYNYNANLSMKYKGVDLYVLLNGIAKWDKYYHSELNSLNHKTGVYTWDKSLLNTTWTEANLDAKIPKVYSNNPINDQNSDFFLRKADFLRVKTIQLGYSLPANYSKILKMDKIRFYVNLENYFLFTSWPGQDPENSDLVYPSMKTASLGLNLSF